MKTELEKLTKQQLEKIVDQTIEYNKSVQDNLLDTNYIQFKIEKNIPEQLKSFADDLWSNNDYMSALFGVYSGDEWAHQLEKIFNECSSEASWIIKKKISDAYNYISEFKFSDDLQEELDDIFDDFNSKLEDKIISEADYEHKILTHKLYAIITETDYVIDYSLSTKKIEDTIYSNKEENQEKIASVWSYGINLWIDELNNLYDGIFKIDHVNFQLGSYGSTAPVMRHHEQLKYDSLGYKESNPSWDKEFVINLSVKLIKEDDEQQIYLSYWNKQRCGISKDLHFEADVFYNLVADYNDKIIQELTEI